MNSTTPLRVRHLAGYGLEVPDVSVAEKFYTSFGLAADPLGEALQLRAAQTGPAEIVVVKGAQKRLHHLSFAINDIDVERFAEHLKTRGVATATPPFGALRDGLWFQDPWGTWLNLVPVQTVEPVLALEPKLVHPRVDRHLWQELNRKIRPTKLGHLLMFTPEYDRAEAFYCETLGLRITDRVPGKVAFFSGGSGIRDHHCFGLIPSTHRGFQHGSFQVDSVDDIGFGAMQMRAAGYREGFGLGRHALASNLFHYTRDPWGSWVEYYADMDKISEAWQTRDWNGLPYIWPDWAPEFWGKEMNGNFEPR
jgi:catechol 2,3-dioxygenase-like lactoylglutathione lyase family enzyme